MLKLADLVEKVDGEVRFIYSREEVGREPLVAGRDRSVVADLTIASSYEPVPVSARLEQPPAAVAEAQSREPVLLDVGSRIDALRAGRPVPEASNPSPPSVASRNGLDRKSPKADPGVAPAGYQAEPPVVAAKAADRRHIVGRGETFETSPKACYGSPRFSRALWWANRGAIAWPGALAAGKQIVIPPVDELDRRDGRVAIAATEAAALPTLEQIVAQPSVERRSPSRLEARSSPRVDPEVQPAHLSKPSSEVEPAAEGGVAVHVVRSQRHAPRHRPRLVRRRLPRRRDRRTEPRSAPGRGPSPSRPAPDPARWRTLPARTGAVNVGRTLGLRQPLRAFAIRSCTPWTVRRWPRLSRWSWYATSPTYSKRKTSNRNLTRKRVANSR